MTNAPMIKVKKAMLIWALLLVGCSPGIAAPAIAQTPIMASETPSLTQAPTATPTIQPTVNLYCDPTETNAAIKQLFDISGLPDETEATVTPAATSTNSGPLTDAQRALIINAFKEKQNELTALNVPECLAPAKEHLINSFTGFIKLFSADKNTTSDDAMSNLFYISVEEKSFQDGIKQIKDCLRQGCPTPTKQP